MGRIVRFHRTGGPEELRLEQAPPEAPRAGEVVLDVLAIGLNNSEAQLRRGDYPMASAALPSRLGRECVGRIAALGQGVTAFAVGERVATLPAFLDVARHGVYGEWAVVPADALVRPPASQPTLEAAASWQQYLTAYGPLVSLGFIDSDDWVLVTAAASSVGRGAIQMAKLAHARVIATTRSADKRDVLLAAGADAVIVTGAEPLAARVAEITGGAGFSVALDPVAGPGLAELAEAAGRGATIFLYGQLDAGPVPLPLVPVLRKGLTLRGYTLWEITLDPGRRARAEAFILERLASGLLKPAIDRVFALDDIVEAHRYLESGRQTGKIVIDVAGGSR